MLADSHRAGLAVNAYHLAPLLAPAIAEHHRIPHLPAPVLRSGTRKFKGSTG